MLILSAPLHLYYGGDFLEVLCGIYEIRNKINGKIYIGQSVNIYRRFKSHKTAAFNSNSKQYNSYLYNSIRKYGLNSFEFTVLEICNKINLNERELYYINLYNSYDNKFGYNQTKIINNRNVISKNWDEDKFKELKIMLRDFNIPMRDISNYFNVNFATISAINRGEVMRDDNESYPIRNNIKRREFLKQKNQKLYECQICNKPTINKNFCSKECNSTSNFNNSLENILSKDSLEYLIIRESFEKIGKKYGVTGKTISKLCKKYGLPYKKSDIKIIYEKEINKLKEEKVNYMIENGISFNKSYYNVASSVKKVLYPTFEEIYAKSFNVNSFMELSKLFNIDNGTFRWYLKKNNLPSNIDDIRNYNI